jgi:hypothetical protein
VNRQNASLAKVFKDSSKMQGGRVEIVLGKLPWKAAGSFTGRQFFL